MSDIIQERKKKMLRGMYTEGERERGRERETYQAIRKEKAATKVKRPQY